MCTYSADPATPGVPTDWHSIHYGSFATGGAGLIVVEATAISPIGRISPYDLGIWNDEQVAAWKPITSFAHTQGTHIGIQLAHAGRKASTYRPWDNEKGSVPDTDGGWQTIAPSAVAFEGYADPRELSESDIAQVTQEFADAAQRAVSAGFDVLELHAAHGYLLHQFLSPLSNKRTDRYGGGFEERTRLLVEVVDTVRQTVGNEIPLFVRLSATDWHPEGIDTEFTVELTKLLREHHVDLIDVSTGGLIPHVKIPVHPGYQVPFATAVKETGILASAVGLITEPEQAATLVTENATDAVFLGRAFLRNPHWPLAAAKILQTKTDINSHPVAIPQYQRAL